MEFLFIIIGVLAVGALYSLGVASAKPVPGSDFYKVSKDGRVLASGGPKVTALRPKVTPEGLMVKLRNGNRTGEFLVHELVAEAHLPNPSGLKWVRHKDGNPRNNKVENLAWSKEPVVEPVAAPAPPAVPEAPQTRYASPAARAAAAAMAAAAADAATSSAPAKTIGDSLPGGAPHSPG
ncbi:HNH endonuclease [Duganella sp. S19_KUP01_CR8]|uniref:HNH endonuclease n=1 Tax=Duganella sp. S19_KUP01_CR8 TaxID=3025502 RepID=UPI002FCDC5FB